MLKTERGTFHKSNMGKQKNREASLKMDGAPNIVARFGLKQKWGCSLEPASQIVRGLRVTRVAKYMGKFEASRPSREKAVSQILKKEFFGEKRERKRDGLRQISFVSWKVFNAYSLK